MVAISLGSKFGLRPNGSEVLFDWIRKSHMIMLDSSGIHVSFFLNGFGCSYKSLELLVRYRVNELALLKTLAGIGFARPT